MSKAAPVFVTGGTGFVGRYAVRALLARGYPVRLLARSVPARLPDGVTYVQGALEHTPSYASELGGCSAVIHLAARAHVVRDRSANPLAAFRRANTEATRQIAQAAKAAGIESFVFVSSIGVNGDRTDESCFGPDSPPAPTQFYAISKLEAEQALGDLAGPGFKVTIIRPPLVYGTGAPGNFRRLLALAQSGVPLPLGGLDNRRSLIGVESLVDLLMRCLAPANISDLRTFLAADATPISTTEIIAAMAEGLQVPLRVFALPAIALTGARWLPPTRRLTRQLFDSLCVDPEVTAGATGWTPLPGPRAGLVAMASAFRNSPW